MENMKNAGARFSDEELEKAIKTYNIYIANKEAFKIVNEDNVCEYDETKSFSDNVNDEINFWSAVAKIKATVPDTIKLATYVFEKAVCPILETKGCKITEISVIPTYGDIPFPEFTIRIECETVQVSLFLDCESFRIGGALMQKEKTKISYQKITCKGFTEDKDLKEGFVISTNKFEFSQNNPLSLDYLKECILRDIKKDCQSIIESALS